MTIFFSDVTAPANTPQNAQQVRASKLPTLVWEVVDYTEELALDSLTYDGLWWSPVSGGALENIVYNPI